MGRKPPEPLETKIACTSISEGKPLDHPMSPITAELLRAVAVNSSGDLPLPVYKQGHGEDDTVLGSVISLWHVTEADGNVGLWARVSPYMAWPDGTMIGAVIDVASEKLLHCALAVGPIIDRQEFVDLTNAMRSVGNAATASGTSMKDVAEAMKAFAADPAPEPEPEPEPVDEDAELDEDGLERARAEFDLFDEEAGT